MTWFKWLTFLAIGVLGPLADAQRVFAWGPGVHTVMALHLLNDVSLVLPAVARAVLAFPWEYLYGCLAADFFIGKTHRRRLAGAHNWEGGSRLLRGAADDREAAYAYGFLSHLAADVVAHNFFIPNIMRWQASSRGMGHLFWEMKADYLSGPNYTKLARAALSMEHPECDELLRAVTGRARNGLKAKKHLFTQSVKFSDYVYDKHDLFLSAMLSQRRSAEQYTGSMLKLSCRAVTDLMANPESAACLRYDPLGRRRVRFKTVRGILGARQKSRRPAAGLGFKTRRRSS